MTGLEPAAAGQFLAPHAAKIAQRLARRATYRWRMERAVRKLVGVNYPRSLYRAWLKTLTEGDLATPVETAGPHLAQRLDDLFGQRDAEWRGRPDRTSLSSRLVVATYTALVGAADPAQVSRLSAQWSRDRHEDIVVRLDALAQGSLQLTNDDYALVLRRRSAERRRLRLLAFGLTPDDVAESLASIPSGLPLVPPGSVRVLVGPFGSGKSEIAEQWHLAAVVATQAGEHTPVPVWIHAREAYTLGLEHVLLSRLGAAVVNARGVAAVIDGLDEIEGAGAEAITHDARVLVAGDGRSSVLLTCRPGVLLNTSDEIRVDGLDEASGRNLVEAVAGGRTNVWTWTPDLRDTIRRPFFALAAGSLIAAGEVPTGQVDLVSRLTRLALRRVPATTSGANDVNNVLVGAAAALTETNGGEDGLTFAQRQLALSTRLVSVGAGERISFALPILQQWFAAQALVDGSRSVDSVLTSPASFDRWRWSIAIAASDAPAQVGDDVLQACLEMNPGAGAWIVEQVSAGRNRWRPTENPPLDPEVAARRLLRATRSWIDATGPLAPKVLPITQGARIRLGVRVEGHSIATGWSTPGADDEVVELPAHVHPLGAEDGEWVAWRAGRVPDGDLWPWALVRDDFARQTRRLLDQERLLGPPGGVWQRERRYQVARIILRQGTVFQPPLDRLEILATAESLLSAVDDPNTTRYSIGAKHVGGDEVLDLRDWLAGENFASLARPVPGADLTQPAGGGGMVWDLYSRERMILLCAEMLGLACQAYDELVDTLLPSFGWSLGRDAISPFGAVGSVAYRDNGVRGLGPTLEFSNLPMELVHQDIVTGKGLVVSGNGRAAVRLAEPSDQADDREGWSRHAERIDQWATKTGIDSPFRSLGGVTTTVVECSHARPASFQAARWVWNDLQRLSLASGTSPRLGS